MEKNIKATKNKMITTQDMVLIAMFAALLAICTMISIPTAVPFTLQTFGVFVAVGILGCFRGTLSVVIYILVGAIGAPVFSGFKSGFGVLTGPTGGYIIGFVFAAIIAGLLIIPFSKQSEPIKYGGTIFAMLIGDIVCFVIGTIQFMVVQNVDVSVALDLCVIPFIIPDICKIVVAAIVSVSVKKYVKILR